MSDRRARLALTLVTAPAALAASLPFTSLAIGGGGFTSGVLPTLRSAAGPATVFTRTDVGGIYRLVNDSGALSWLPLTDTFTYQERNWYGGEALALSYTNASRVWTSLGAYFEPDEVNAGIFASDNAGGSWRQISPPGWAVRAGANGSPFRGLGERLAVHPVDENVLLYGSYLDGLWRTTDAGAPAPSWHLVACGVLPCAPAIGALSVTFDASSPGGNTAYASFPGSGVYVSIDAGATWAASAGAPASVNRLMVSLTFADTGAVQPAAAPLLYAAATDGLWRLANGAWALAAPQWANRSFVAVDVNPFDARDVSALSDSGDAAAPGGMVRTLDGGASWHIVGASYIKSYVLPWWPGAFDWNGTTVDFRWGGSNIRYGTTAPGQLWLGDFWDVWLCANWDVAVPFPPPQLPPPVWWQVVTGHEEVFVLSMIAPHVGPTLVTGTADLAGFVHSGAWSAYPDFTFFGPGAWGGEGTGAAYSERVAAAGPGGSAVPEVVVVAQARAFAAGNGPAVSLSRDGGRSWAASAFNSSAPELQQAEVLGVAVGAWNASALVVLVSNSTPWASADGGATWRRSSGLPPYPFPVNGFSGNRYNHSKPLAASRPTVEPTGAGGSGFLYADCASGALFASPDGVAWAPVPGGGFPAGPRCALEPHPTPAGGAFWLAADAGGLFFSAEGGGGAGGWARVAGVARAHTVAAGAPAMPGGEPVVYVFGLPADAPTDDDLHVLASADRGASWVPLRASNGKGLGNWPETLVASRAHAGLFAVGSFGRGALWANASGLLQAA